MFPVVWCGTSLSVAKTAVPFIRTAKGGRRGDPLPVPLLSLAALVVSSLWFVSLLSLGSILLYSTGVYYRMQMADIYVSDSVFAQYVEAHGGDAKQAIRDTIEAHAPTSDTDD